MVKSASVLLLGGLLILASPASGREQNPVGGGIYLGADYFTGTADTGLHDFLYIVPGLVVDEPTWHLDVRSAAVVLIPDGIFALFGFLASGESDFPLWGSLNADDDNPGCLRMLESEFRYAFKTMGDHKLDAGMLFDVWWMTPFVAGKQFANIVWNLGPSVGWGFKGRIIGTNLSLQAGNGFSAWGNFNPFVGAEAMVRLQVWKGFGLYARALGRLQNYDYSGFESNDMKYPPELFDIRKWEFTMSADVGLMLHAF